MPIKTTDDDANSFAWLDCAMPSKEKRTYGQRIIEACVPRYFRDVQAMHLKTEISYQTLHSWKTGASEPRMSQLEPVSRALGFDVVTLLSPDRERGAMREHPGWPEAVAEAKRKAGRRLPASAFDAAGATSGSKLPEHLDAEFVVQLAEFWWRHASDDEATRAETESARREMAAIDAKRKR